MTILEPVSGQRNVFHWLARLKSHAQSGAGKWVPFLLNPITWEAGKEKLSKETYKDELEAGQAGTADSHSVWWGGGPCFKLALLKYSLHPIKFIKLYCTIMSFDKAIQSCDWRLWYRPSGFWARRTLPCSVFLEQMIKTHRFCFLTCAIGMIFAMLWGCFEDMSEIQSEIQCDQVWFLGYTCAQETVGSGNCHRN